MRMPTDNPAYVAPDSDPELDEEEQQEELERSLVDPPFRQAEVNTYDWRTPQQILDGIVLPDPDDIMWPLGTPPQGRGQKNWEGDLGYTLTATEDFHLEMERLESLIYDLCEKNDRSGHPPPQDLTEDWSPSYLATHRPDFDRFIALYRDYTSLPGEETRLYEVFEEVEGLGWPEALWLMGFLEEHDPLLKYGASKEEEAEWSSKRIDFLTFARKVYEAEGIEALHDGQFEFVTYDIVRQVIAVGLIEHSQALEKKMVASGAWAENAENSEDTVGLASD